MLTGVFSAFLILPNSGKAATNRRRHSAVTARQVFGSRAGLAASWRVLAHGALISRLEKASGAFQRIAEVLSATPVLPAATQEAIALAVMEQ